MRPKFRQDLLDFLLSGKSNTKSTHPAKIKELYEANRAHVLHKKLDDSKEYLKQTTKAIPLNELYEVVDFIQCTQHNVCPVLLEIKHPEILMKENDLQGGVDLDSYEFDLFRYLL